MLLFRILFQIKKKHAKPSGVTGSSVPRDFLHLKLLLTYREKRGKEKRENGERGREIEKGKKEKFSNEERTSFIFYFYFYFYFLFIYFVLFCLFFFFFGFHFSKALKFVLGVPKWKFSKALQAGKKSGKVTLSPQKHFPVKPLAKTCIF